MLNRALILAISLSALAACGAPTAGTDATAEAATAVVVTDEECAYSDNYDAVASIPEIFSEMVYESDDPNDANVGVVVAAPKGSSCTGSAANDQTLTCVVNGPHAALTIQDTVLYAIPEGRTATLAVNGAEGTTSCFLNEAAG